MYKPGIICTLSLLYCDAVTNLEYIYIETNIYKYYVSYANVNNPTSYLLKLPLSVLNHSTTYSIS